MRQHCADLTKQTAFKDKISKYHQDPRTKPDLEIAFRESLLGISDEKRQHLGITDALPATLDAFLLSTNAFENQMMDEINNNVPLREKAKEDLIANAVEVACDEYDITGLETDPTSQKSKLIAALRHEEQTAGIKRINTFLESARYRKILIHRALPSGLSEKAPLSSEINFDDLHKKIINLDPTKKDSKIIKDVWGRLLGGWKIQDGESLQEAFRRTLQDGTEGDLTGDFQTFFNCSESLIS